MIGYQRPSLFLSQFVQRLAQKLQGAVVPVQGYVTLPKHLSAVGGDKHV